MFFAEGGILYIEESCMHLWNLVELALKGNTVHLTKGVKDKSSCVIL